MKKLLLTLLLALVSTSAMAEWTKVAKGFDPADTACTAYVDSSINNDIQQIEYVDKDIPAVPPEEHSEYTFSHELE